MCANLYEARSDSFYFVNDRLIMHNKAQYRLWEMGVTCLVFSSSSFRYIDVDADAQSKDSRPGSGSAAKRVNSHPDQPFRHECAVSSVSYASHLFPLLLLYFGDPKSGTGSKAAAKRSSKLSGSSKFCPVLYMFAICTLVLVLSCAGPVLWCVCGVRGLWCVSLSILSVMWRFFGVSAGALSFIMCKLFILVY